MVKAIGYAYPSSTTATRLGAGKSGCYYVETKRHETQAAKTSLAGPFASIEDAERHALTIPADWSRYTRRAA